MLSTLMAVIVKVVGCGSVQMPIDFTDLSRNAPHLRSLYRIIASCSVSSSRHRSVVGRFNILNVYSLNWPSASNLRARRAIEPRKIVAFVRQARLSPRRDLSCFAEVSQHSLHGDVVGDARNSLGYMTPSRSRKSWRLGIFGVGR